MNDSHATLLLHSHQSVSLLCVSPSRNVRFRPSHFPVTVRETRHEDVSNIHFCSLTLLRSKADVASRWKVTVTDNKPSSPPHTITSSPVWCQLVTVLSPAHFFKSQGGPLHLTNHQPPTNLLPCFISSPAPSLSSLSLL